MPIVIPFRNGRLDYRGAPDRNITIRDAEVTLALDGAARMLVPESYIADPAAVRTVELASIVLDFGQRMVDYDTNRLRSIITALQSGTRLPPLSVTANPNGTYRLENGYHRFLACALLGFTKVPIDQAAPQLVAAPVPVPNAAPVAKWVSPSITKKRGILE
jgi:hypothetical protein